MKNTLKKIILPSLMITIVSTTLCESTFNAITSWLFKSTQKTYNKTFEITKPTTLSLENIQGSITLRTWSEPRVVLDAVISGKEQEINDIHITTQETPQGTITIRTEQATEAKSKAMVDYTVMMPQEMPTTLTTKNGNISAEGTQGTLTATTHEGNISVTQIRGSLHAHTDYGSIDIAYHYLPPASIVQATSDNGHITLALPSTAQANVAAKTEKGFITTQQTVLLKPQLTQLGRSAWKQFKQQAFFTLGEGGATISLFTKNGTIKITEL